MGSAWEDDSPTPATVRHADRGGVFAEQPGIRSGKPPIIHRLVGEHTVDVATILFDALACFHTVADGTVPGHKGGHPARVEKILEQIQGFGVIPQRIFGLQVWEGDLHVGQHVAGYQHPVVHHQESSMPGSVGPVFYDFHRGPGPGQSPGRCVGGTTRSSPATSAPGRDASALRTFSSRRSTTVRAARGVAWRGARPRASRYRR